MNIGRLNPEPNGNVPAWEMIVEWARVVALVAAAAALSYAAFVGAADRAFEAAFLVAWLSTGVYVAGSFALPDLRATVREVAGASFGKQFRATWELLAPPPAPSPRRLPRILVAGLAVVFVLAFIARWVPLVFGELFASE